MSMSVSCVAGYDQRGAVGGRGELVTVCPRQGSTCMRRGTGRGRFGQSAAF